MRSRSTVLAALPLALVLATAWACSESRPSGDGEQVGRTTPTIPLPGAPTSPSPPSSPSASSPPPAALLDPVEAHAARLVDEGRASFRAETFGGDAFFGGRLRLHEALAGMSPNQLRDLGLGVDVAALPAAYAELIRAGKVDLADRATTIQLLENDAVVGIAPIFSGEHLVSVGLTCALCHSRVDDSFAPRIGARHDGWPNRDLDVGRLLAAAPTLAPWAESLGTDEASLRATIATWGRGRYAHDGSARARVVPSLLGLAGVGLATANGAASRASFIAVDANDTLHGLGALRGKRPTVDLVGRRLPALDVFVAALPAPTPPDGSFYRAAAERGRVLFEGKARCASCHVPPLFTEPGAVTHAGEEIGVEGDARWRTTPLVALFTRLGGGGLYHDGRFADLPAVVKHYEAVLGVTLGDRERADLVEYLKSL